MIKAVICFCVQLNYSYKITKGFSYKVTPVFYVLFFYEPHR